MILRALFGKPEPEPKPQQQAFVFAANDPIFNISKKYSANDLIKSFSGNSSLSKLVHWLNDHPGTSDYVTFCVFTPENVSNFDEIRQVSIKTQVMTGINLIIRQERAIADPNNQQFKPIEHPFPNLSDVHECNELWRMIRVHDSLVSEIDSKVNEIAIFHLKNLKLITAAIVSLLTSVDAIPYNYIPIVNYKEIDVSNKLLANRDSVGRQLQQQSTILQQKNVPLYKSMNQIEDRYALDDMENLQPAIFQSLIEDMRQCFDSEKNIISGYNYELTFLDYLNHPNCKALPSLEFFYKGKTHEAFYSLVRSLISLFEIEDIESRSILYAACTYSFAPYHFPKLQGNTSIDIKVNEANLNLAFYVYIEPDPMKIISYIYDLSLDKDLHQTIQNIIDGLSIFTNDWTTIFKYAVDFTIPEFMPSNLITIRESLSNFIPPPS